MEELTEAHLRILKAAYEAPYVPTKSDDVANSRQLADLGLLDKQSGRYTLSDQGRRYMVRRGLDGNEDYMHR